jgi:simple sugar transport system permease protein/ribose transport system permease protein
MSAMTRKPLKMISEDSRPVLIFLMLLVAIFVVFSFLHREFLSTRNISNLLKHASVSSMFALGALFVVVVGHFDLSFHLVCSLSGMTTSFLIANNVPVLPSIAAGLAAGAVFGFCNGIAIGKMRLPDMVTTIATGAIAWGFAWIYSDGSYIWKNATTSGILLLNDALIFGIPLPVILMLAMYFLANVVLHWSRFGRCFYSTGENRVAAIFSGVRVRAYIIAAFMICAVLASVGAIMGNASQGSGSVRVGMVYLLPAYATIFLGSAIFKKPTVYGTFLAALFISTMLNGFTLMAVPYYYSDFMIGLVLIVALALSSSMVVRTRFGTRRAGGGESRKEVAQ